MARVAMPVGEDFEDAELTEPRTALTAAGHEVVMVGTRKGQRVPGKRGQATAAIDCAAADVDPEDFDALVIPGGYSPDHLRTHRKMVAFTRAIFDAGKPVAAVCHAGSMLIEADLADGHTVTSDLAAGSARMTDFDALVIPGGHAPEKMRMRHAMVDLARDAMEANKPVAAICHGPQLLISADALRGRTLTCWPSIAIDVKNAGGLYVDKPVVEDGNLITSRKPDDVPLFSEAIIRALTRVHAGGQTARQP